MAFAYVTYKNFAPINLIKTDLTNREGCGLALSSGTEGQVAVAVGNDVVPYGVVVVGAGSIDGTYPGTPVAGSLEIVDMVGVAIQARASDAGAIAAGKLVQIDTGASVPGSFKANNAPTTGDYVWGLALTSCAADEQFIMRFLPYIAR